LCEQLFAKIQIVVDEEVFDVLYEEAEPVQGLVTINAFRSALNVYLEDVENGLEEQWRRARGVSPGNLR